MNSIEQKIYDILLDKQTYLREKKNITEVYFGTEYLQRICDHNGYSADQVTQAVRNLRKAGLIVGKTRRDEGDWVYDYYTVKPIPQGVEDKTDKMTDNDTKTDNYGTYTYESGYTQFTITVAA